MRKLLLLPILMLLGLSELNCQPPTPTQDYTFSTTLDKYILYWDYNSQSITFELHVKNVDWVLFGIQGNNSYSDAIVASIYPDETGFFSETAVSFDLKTKLNPNLKWLLLDAFKCNNGTYIVVKFYRDIKLECDSDSIDVYVDIVTGLNNLLISSGNNFDPSVIRISTASVVQVNLLQDSGLSSQFSCAIPLSQSPSSTPKEDIYTNMVELVPEVFTLYWNVENGNLTAEIHCRTPGWVAFGWSANGGGLDGSNVLAGYISSDGRTSFRDGFLKGSTLVNVQNQSVTLLDSGYQNNYSYFKFTRKLSFCDSEHQSIEVSFFFLFKS